MARRVARQCSTGFTLIEMLIVIVVIAILALITIPRLLGAGRKAKEVALKGDIHQLRDAIQQFEGDCGDFPTSLDQLMARPAPGNAGGTGISLDEVAWQGPYLRTPDGGLPKDPFQDQTQAAEWDYAGDTGDVHSKSTLTAIDGTAYSSW